MPSAGLSSFASTKRPFVTSHTGHKRPLVDGRYGSHQMMNWARLLKGAFDHDLKCCPNCGGKLKVSFWAYVNGTRQVELQAQFRRTQRRGGAAQPVLHSDCPSAG